MPRRFDDWVRATLARYGVEADDVDIAVMRVAEQVYGPRRDALMAADLSGLAPEHGLDPPARRSKRAAGERSPAGPLAARAGELRSTPASWTPPSCWRRRWPDRGTRRPAQLDRRAVRQRVGPDALRGARGAAARGPRRREGHVQPALARAARRRGANLSGMAPGESVVYRRLRDAGAVIVGVTNMHEFGMRLDRPHLGLRAVRQSVGPGPLRGRLVRRLGRGGGGAAGRGRRRLRRRRLDPLPGLLLRSHRPQVHLGPARRRGLHARLTRR